MAKLYELDRAAREPLGVDISDYSDEWCAGFLAGQVNVLELQAREGRDSLEEQFGALEARVQAALRELERASDVRANRTGIIGNVDLILRGESSPASEPDIPPILGVLEDAVDAVLFGSGGVFVVPAGGYLNVTWLTKKKCYRVTMDLAVSQPEQRETPEAIGARRTLAWEQRPKTGVGS